MPGRDSLDVLVKNGAVRRQAAEEAASEHESPEVQRHPLLHLQRQMGNAYVARLLAQRAGMPEEQIQTKRDPALVQRAEIPEEQILTKRDPESVQRHEEDGVVQASPEVGLDGGPISDALAGRIQSKRGGGAALDSGTQATMESSLGSRFDDVRIHTDTESDALNRSVSAKAFTTGSDIFFSRQASPSDTQLLAHELTHVVQQRGSAPAGPMTVGPAGDSHEAAADAVASAVSSGTPSAAQREYIARTLGSTAEEDKTEPGAAPVGAVVAREDVVEEPPV